jgi:hypothetical protein
MFDPNSSALSLRPLRLCGEKQAEFTAEMQRAQRKDTQRK